MNQETTSTAARIDLAVPSEALKFILFQRMSLQKIGRISNSRFGVFAHKVYDLLPPVQQLYKFYNRSIETRLRAREIKQQYAAEMADELHALRPFLPEKTARILDIGCGVGGFDALLYNHYAAGGDEPELCLVDKSSFSDDIVFGFKQEASAYNSLGVTGKLLEQNGVPAAKIRTVEADDFATIADLECGLVISLYAWGFHFPIDTYVEQVARMLAPDGRLIVHIRKDTDGIDVLKRHFASVETIIAAPRHDCVLAADAKPAAA